MKKNLAKKLVSFALSATLIISSAAMTLAAGSTGDIEGSTDVELGVIDVVVPTTAQLKTYINPLELKDAGSQLKTGDFVFANKSNVDVKVNVNFKIIATDDAITVVDDRTDVNDYDGNGDETVTTKQIYMKLVPATSMTMSTPASDAAQLTVQTASPNAVVYPALTTATAGAVIARDTATPAAVDFYLAKANIADEGGAFASGDTGAGLKGIAVMRLKGAVNPFATYVANEFKIIASYKITGIKAANYAAYDGLGTRDALGYNVKAIKSAVLPPAGTAPTITPSVASIAKTTSGTLVFTYDLGTDALAGDTVKSITIDGSTDLLTWGQTLVTHNTNAKTITLLNACIKASGFTAGANKTVTLTFDNGKTATCQITITAS